MYDVMVSWENADALADQPTHIRNYGEIWRAADKVVYSTTLGASSSTRTQIERDFDVDAVCRAQSLDGS